LQTLLEVVSARTRPALHIAVIPDLVNPVFFKNIRQRLQREATVCGDVFGGQDGARHQAAIDLGQPVVSRVGGMKRMLARFALRVRQVAPEYFGLLVAGAGDLGIGLASGLMIAGTVPDDIIFRLCVSDQV